MTDEIQSDDVDSAKAVIAQIWQRARINAFAHRNAEERLKRKAQELLMSEVALALLSILFIIVVGLVSSNEEPHVSKGQVLGFTIASVVCALGALLCTVINASFKFEAEAEFHAHLQARYQYIAQRSRQVKWTGRPPETVCNLLRELETEFSLLKVVGKEPRDVDFIEATRIFVSVQSDPDTSVAQSFIVGAPEEMARHVGEPRTDRGSDPDRPPAGPRDEN